MEEPSRPGSLHRKGLQRAGMTPLAWGHSGWVILVDSLEVIPSPGGSLLSPTKPLPEKCYINVADTWS